MPAPRSSAAKGDQRFGGALERLEMGDLRADVAVQPDDLHAPALPRIRRHISRASSMATPNLLLFRPVEMCGWLCASMSGLTRTATRAVSPRAVAIASMRSISPSDSALMLRERRGSMARSSSASDLADAGEDDFLAGVNPARSATSISPPELASAAAPRPRSSRGDRQRRVGFERVVERCG